MSLFSPARSPHPTGQSCRVIRPRRSSLAHTSKAHRKADWAVIIVFAGPVNANLTMRRSATIIRHLRAPALLRRTLTVGAGRTSAASLKKGESWIAAQKLDARPDLSRKDVIVPEQLAKFAATLNADVLEPQSGGKHHSCRAFSDGCIASQCQCTRPRTGSTS
jgi:hypothetical protein